MNAEIGLIVINKLEGIERRLETLIEASEAKYLCVPEVAKMCGVTPSAIRWRLINDANISPHDYRRDGKKYLILRSSVNKFAPRRSIKQKEVK
ncbi:MAG: helix-turn-helix domain-containing protein [Helicobacteraceae bacterium]|jgi:hypothetical protein|nr:helix-turn-helix domain-containing protein [Helicobacteraceae bacterium]